jgi:hypothetical protein
MAKLDIGIGEDFPVEEKTEREECRSRRGRHRHEHRGRWHQWMREQFWGSDKKKDKEH